MAEIDEQPGLMAPAPVRAETQDATISCMLLVGLLSVFLLRRLTPRGSAGAIILLARSSLPSHAQKQTQRKWIVRAKSTPLVEAQHTTQIVRPAGRPSIRPDGRSAAGALFNLLGVPSFL
jgi:hypothetical protein